MAGHRQPERENPGLPATPWAGLPADADRTEGRRGGAVDAAGRVADTFGNTRANCRTRRTRTPRTGWPERCGRSARDTRRSAIPIPRSRHSSRPGWTWPSPRCAATCSTTTAPFRSSTACRCPNWLIVDGADASSEAVLGLAAYVKAGGDRPARTALQQLAAGIAAMSAGSTTGWPYRALLPWALSRSFWHAWGSNMPAALAAASDALRDKSLLSTAVGDAAGFSPQLLTSTGPVNGLLPTPGDATPDRLRRRRPGAGPARRRHGDRPSRDPPTGRHRGRLVLRPERRRDCGVRPGDRRHQGRRQPGRRGQPQLRGRIDHSRPADHAGAGRQSGSGRAGPGLGVHPGPRRTAGGRGGKRRHSVREPLSSTRSSAWTGESQWSGNYVAAGPGSTITWTLAGQRPTAAGAAGGRTDARFDCPQHADLGAQHPRHRPVRSGRRAGQRTRHRPS